MKPVFLLVALFSVPVSADQNLTVRQERDHYGTRLQQAISYLPNQVVMSRNTNWVCPLESVVRLGVFHADYDESQVTNRSVVEQLMLRLAKRGDESPQPIRRHEVRSYLGTHEVTRSPAYAPAIRGIMRDACRSQKWKARAAVQISHQKAGGQNFLVLTELGEKIKEPKPVRLSFKQAGCTLQSGRWECRLPQWGVVFFEAGP